MLPKSGGRAAFLIWVAALATAHANTSITFSRSDIASMATLWETDCVSVSSPANNQYPNVAGVWDFIVPHTSISADGDIHVDMAIDAAGNGAASNNTGESPLICEVINANSGQLSHLDGLTNQRATFRGIFRFYTEHAGERHFELHPVTQLQRWNGSTFVTDVDYHSNIVAVPDGATHTSSTLSNLLNGSQMITATVAADDTAVTLDCPSPSVNYVQYDGVAVSGVASDTVSQYFLFQPNLVPSVTVRCRLISNTGAASAAAAIMPNQALTVNAMTRTDLAAVNSQVGSMSANQQKSFVRPIEFIVLGLPTIGPGPTPTPSSSTFISSTSIAILTNSHSPVTAANPYPSSIAVSGVPGVVSKVTVGLNDFSTSSLAYPEDIDILLGGPFGQSTMLMSDAGGGNQLRHVNLVFDDTAASPLPGSSPSITSGTYRPTNFNPLGDNDAFPAPAPAKPFGSSLQLFNGTSPNGTWNLFALDEYVEGSGSIAGGWSLTISTVPAAPIVATKAATGMMSTTANLNGTINPLGVSSSFAFQLGRDTNYGFAQEIQSAGTGTDAVPVTLNITGLRPGTMYHYRLTGLNSAGSTTGADQSFTTAALVDTDADGMPNDYENANGFNAADGTDGSEDFDGDGVANLQEYLAGTDPTAANSVLRISSIGISGGDVVINFPSVLGKTYRVEQRSQLSDNWALLSDNVGGTGGSISVTDVEAADRNTARFYRITVMP
ncbi:MAG: hypothetical protein ACJ8M1_00285 [Chthoniobacterales bacterium]